MLTTYKLLPRMNATDLPSVQTTPLCGAPAKATLSFGSKMASSVSSRSVGFAACCAAREKAKRDIRLTTIEIRFMAAYVSRGGWHFPLSRHSTSGGNVSESAFPLAAYETAQAIQVGTPRCSRGKRAGRRPRAPAPPLIGLAAGIG